MTHIENEDIHSTLEYIGWIPCLAGELLYSHTEPGLGEYDIVTINFVGSSKHEPESKRRFIAVTSVYDWKDSGDPRESGVFRVVMLAKTPPADTTLLYGEVYFISEIPRQSQVGLEQMPSRCEAEERLLCQLRSIASSVKRVQRSISRQSIVAEHAELLKLQEHVDFECGNAQGNLALLINAITNKHVNKVQFEIDHYGFCKLQYVGLKDPLSEHYGPPTLPANSPLREFRLKQQDSTLCRQCYYYLKFLFHKHAHHDPHNDSLATTHQDRGLCYNTARAMIHDLKLGLVDVKRADRKENSGFAGIATYGKSLVTSCYKAGFFNDCADPAREYRVQHDYFDHLSQSVGLLHDRHKPHRERRRQRLTTVQQLLTVVFLFVTPLILIGRDIEPIVAPPELAGATPIGYLQYLIARLGHGDVGLLLFIYFIVTGGAFALHHLLIDSKFKAFTTSRSAFSYMRTQAFSIPRCRMTLAERIIWPLHRSLVTGRRLLRGMEYKQQASTGWRPFLIAFFAVCIGFLTMIGSLWLLLGFFP